MTSSRRDVSKRDSSSLLRAAATERDVGHGMEFPQRRGLHAPLASGLTPDVRIVVEQLPGDFDARGMSQDRSSR